MSATILYAVLVAHEVVTVVFVGEAGVVDPLEAGDVTVLIGTAVACRLPSLIFLCGYSLVVCPLV